MIQKYTDLFKTNKEKVLLVGAIALSSITFLWLTQKPTLTEHKGEPTEMGVSVPTGFLVIPLELANGSTLSMMISRSAVIDVFKGASLIAQNLRVLKLNNDDNPAFGALVPDKQAAVMQGVFALKNLRGALKKLSQEPTKFFSGSKRSTAIEIIKTEE